MLNIDLKPVEVKKALQEGANAQKAIIKTVGDRLEKFVDQREIHKRINEPMKLAENAKGNLEALKESLQQNPPSHPDSDGSLEKVSGTLKQITIRACGGICQTSLKKKKK